jgi:hypothetical protein
MIKVELMARGVLELFPSATHKLGGVCLKKQNGARLR